MEKSSESKSIDFRSHDSEQTPKISKEYEEGCKFYKSKLHNIGKQDLMTNSIYMPDVDLL